mmetsp:Transcript_23396/g.51352  ORF Transcript_23396/g.51352 Transcript_23396/m.51352 type:complete len:436 (+) Transcript_23396:123-1430(+)
MHKLGLLFALALAALVLPGESRTPLDVAKKYKCTHFLAVVSAANATSVLSDPSLSATVLVFKNSGLDNLLEKWRVSRSVLLADTVLLQELLLYHILPSPMKTSTLVRKSPLATLQPGQTITARRTFSGRVQLRGTAPDSNTIVSNRDHSAGKSIVHLVDEVLYFNIPSTNTFKSFSSHYKGRVLSTTVPVIIDIPAKPTGVGMVLTHGEGGRIDTEGLPQYAHYFAAAGITVVRFACTSVPYQNFRNDVYHAVLNNATMLWPETKNITKWILSGRSDGARGATEIAYRALTGLGTNMTSPIHDGVRNDDIGDPWTANNAGLKPINASLVRGVLSFSYPLLGEDGKTDIRSVPLINITQPLMFISGTQDPYMTRNLTEWRNIMTHLASNDTTFHYVPNVAHLLEWDSGHDMPDAAIQAYLNAADAVDWVMRVAGAA